MGKLLLALGLVLIPAPAYADHDEPRCYEDGYCEGNQYEHDYSNHDRNRNRDRERGAFSPGPFDRSPVDVTICAPGATCYGQPDEGSEPRS